MVPEGFGCGISVAVDRGIRLGRQPDSKGDRVRITTNGRLQPYKGY